MEGSGKINFFYPKNTIYENSASKPLCHFEANRIHNRTGTRFAQSIYPFELLKWFHSKNSKSGQAGDLEWYYSHGTTIYKLNNCISVYSIFIKLQML